MPYLINDECIMCDACAEACPVKAITAADPKYIIDPDICNDCCECAEVCPVAACVPEDE